MIYTVVQRVLSQYTSSVMLMVTRIVNGATLQCTATGTTGAMRVYHFVCS